MADCRCGDPNCKGGRRRTASFPIVFTFAIPDDSSDEAGLASKMLEFAKTIKAVDRPDGVQLHLEPSREMHRLLVESANMMKQYLEEVSAQKARLN